MANVRALRRLIRRRRFRRRRKVYRRQAGSNPLENLSEAEIWDRYRFSQRSIMFIVEMIRPQIASATRRSMSLSPLLQVLLALRYFATGSYFSLVGESMGVSKAATIQAVHRVTKAICDLGRRFISFPTGREASTVKASFYNIAGKNSYNVILRHILLIVTFKHLC